MTLTLDPRSTIETTDAPPLSGSHVVQFIGGKAIVRNVELYCGRDPGIDIDGVDDSAAKSPEEVRAIVKRTLAYMARGQFPQIVVLHEQDGKDVPEEPVGRIPALRFEDREGVPYIVGDQEFSREFFESFIATNRLPRRSAEIWGDGYMSEVALLGRDTPRRPIPDTHFARAGEKSVHTRAGTKSRHAEVGIGGGCNTFIPAAGTSRKDKNMTDDETLRKELDAMKARCEKAEADLADYKRKNERDDEDDEEVKKSKDKNARAIGDLKEENSRLARELGEARISLARETFSREIDAMVGDGYQVQAHRETMIAELCAAPDPKAKLKFWRDTFARSSIGVRIAPGVAAPDTVAAAGGMTLRQASERAVELAKGDKDAFARHFTELTKGLDSGR